jgi:hypothetical protein
MSKWEKTKKFLKDHDEEIIDDVALILAFAVPVGIGYVSGYRRGKRGWQVKSAYEGQFNNKAALWIDHQNGKTTILGRNVSE